MAKRSVRLMPGIDVVRRERRRAIAETSIRHGANQRNKYSRAYVEAMLARIEALEAANHTSYLAVGTSEEPA